MEGLVKEFRAQLKKASDYPLTLVCENDYEIQLQHGKYNQMKTRVNLQPAKQVYYFKRDVSATPEQSIDDDCDRLRDRLHFLNHIVCEKLNEHLIRAIENSLAACRYHFFAYDGPIYQRLSLPYCPFVGNYFAYPNGEIKSPNEVNKLIESDVQYQSYVYLNAKTFNVS